MWGNYFCKLWLKEIKKAIILNPKRIGIARKKNLQNEIKFRLTLFSLIRNYGEAFILKL